MRSLNQNLETPLEILGVIQYRLPWNKIPPLK